MRKLLFKSFAIGAAALMSLGVTGCSEYGNDVRIEGDPGINRSEIFDFQTRSGISINLDLGLRVNYAVSVYAEYPYLEDANGEMAIKPGLDPVYAFFTKDGYYDGQMELANDVKKVYLVPAGIGVPQIIEAEVVNGVVMASVSTRAIETFQNTSTTAQYTAFTAPQFSYSRINGVSNMSPLYAWNDLGAPLDDVKGPSATSVEEFHYEYTATATELTTSRVTIKFGPTSTITTYDDENHVVSQNEYTSLTNWRNGVSLFNMDKWAKSIAANAEAKANGQSADNNIASVTYNEEELTGYVPIHSDSKVYLNLDKKANVIMIFSGENKAGKFQYEYTPEGGAAQSPVECNIVNSFAYSGIWEKGSYTISRVGSASCDLLYLSINYLPEHVALPADEEVFFTSEGIQKTAGDNSIFNFSHVGSGNTIQAIKGTTIDNSTSLDYDVVIGDNTYTHHYWFPESGENNPESNIHFTLNAPKARLTVYLSRDRIIRISNNGNGSNSTAPKVSSKDAVPCIYQREIVRSEVEGADYINMRNNKSGLVKIVLEYIDDYVEPTAIAVTTSKNKIDDNSYKQYYHRDFVTDDYAGLSTLSQKLTSALWRNNSGGKAGAKLEYGRFFNSPLSYSEDAKNNITTLTDDTELSVTFIGEYDMYSANVFGYFYYDKNSKPVSPDEVNKYIIFPNCTSTDYKASTYKYAYYGTDGKRAMHEELAPLATGNQVKLMYNDNGTFTDKFPKDLIVGWFIIYNGFDAWTADYSESSKRKNNDGQVASGNIRFGGTYVNNSLLRSATDNPGALRTPTFYYSNPSWNSGNPKSRCVQLSETAGNPTRICLSFEDSSEDVTPTSYDMTYDDLIFMVSASAPIQNNAGGVVPDDPNDLIISYHQKGTYLFEDIWDGSATDYDMNDMVIEYDRTFQKTQLDRIVYIEEDYKFLGHTATYEDGFVIKVPYSKADVDAISVTVSAPGKSDVNYDLLAGLSSPSSVRTGEPRIDEVDSDGKFSISLFDDAFQVEEGTTFKVYVVSNGGIPQSVFNPVGNWEDQKNGYNPYIIVYNYEGTGELADKRCEIHMPGKPTTLKGVAGGFHNNCNWYVAIFDDGKTQMPYAIDVPNHSSNGNAFKIMKENAIITSGYENFSKWVKEPTNATYKEWYNNPSSSGEFQN